MKRVAIIQARMRSTRLPGKISLDLGGKPMLLQQINRIKRCKEIEEIVIATTEKTEDDTVVRLAEKEGVRWYRGSEQDVLSRYVGAAGEARADVVVRITSDCPLLDAEECDRVIQALINNKCLYDYAANVVVRTYPRGLDIEALFIDTLKRIDRLAVSKSSREHVTSFVLKERPNLFSICSIMDVENNSELRWTVDTQEDLMMMRRLYELLNLSEYYLAYREILKCVKKNPAISKLNHSVKQKIV